MNQKAFTLIELLVVISIVSLLSSVVMASVSKARGLAIYTKKSSEMREIVRALETYMVINGHYPDRSISAIPSNQVEGYDSGGNAVRYPLGYCGVGYSAIGSELSVNGILPAQLDGTSNDPNGACYEFVRHDQSGSYISAPGYEYILLTTDPDMLEFGVSEIADCRNNIWSSGSYPFEVYCMGVPYQGVYQPGQ